MSIASLGIDFGVLNALNLWVACLLPTKEGQPQLVSFVFHEDRPDLGEIKLVSREVSSTLPTGAHDLVLPWCNYSRMMSLWLWHGWLEGSNLCAFASPTSPVARISLGAPPSHLVLPPLAVSSGEFDVPFLAPGGRELGLARFVPGRDAAAPSGSTVWQTPLAREPVSARAALGPEKAGSLRRVVLVSQEKDAVALQLLDLATGKPPAGPTNIRLPASFALPGAEPGIRIDSEGVTHVSTLVASGPDLLDVSIVDVAFPRIGDQAVGPQIEKVYKFTEPPMAASVSFQTRPDRPMRRDWAALQRDGSLVHKASSGKPMKPRGKVVTPLQLVSLSQTTYILTLQLDGPILEPLR
jgi:hypothetical protein